jgi:poly(A) polymerase
VATAAANLDSFFPKAARLCKKIQVSYPQTYIVGGAVRNALLGLRSPDVDIATEATPDQLKSFLSDHGELFFDVGEKFGTVGVSGGIEVTTFRIDSAYGDARHPDSVAFVKDPKVDAGRRDFTVNAIFYDPTAKRLLDFYGGLRDVQKKVLRFVGDPAARIAEDPLRMLRAVRFAAALGFTVGRADAAAIRKHAALVAGVSGQRTFTELNKIMACGGYVRGISLLDSLGLLKQLLPEVARLKSVKQSRNYHAEGNVFIHTLAVLGNLQAAPTELRWAGLLHDVGKFGTQKNGTRDGRAHVSFHGHAQAGAEAVRGIASRLAFPADLRDHVVHLTAHHMDFTVLPNSMDSAARLRWAQDLLAESVIRLRTADSLGAIMTDGRGQVLPKDTSELERVLRQIKRDRRATSPDLVTGDDVMRVLGIRAGERVGKALRAVKLAQLEKKVSDRRTAISFLKELDIHRL